MNNEKIKELIGIFSLNELEKIKDVLSKIIFVYDNAIKNEEPFPITVNNDEIKIIFLIEGLVSRADAYYHAYNVKWTETNQYVLDFGKKDDWLEHSSVGTLKRIFKIINNEIENTKKSKLVFTYGNGWLNVVYIKKDGKEQSSRFQLSSNNAKLLESLRKNSKQSLDSLSKQIGESKVDYPDHRKRVLDVVKYIRQQLNISANSSDDIFSIANKECELIVPIK